MGSNPILGANFNATIYRFFSFLVKFDLRFRGSFAISWAAILRIVMEGSILVLAAATGAGRLICFAAPALSD
jgi:hypothetical protein